MPLLPIRLLAASIGLALLAGAYSLHSAGAMTLLAAGTAISFAAIDIRYALSGRIAPVYLLDAAVEIGFLVALMVAGLRASQSPTKRNG